MIFEIISGGEKTDWVGKEWAGLFFPRGKNGPAHSFPGEKTDWGEIPACYTGTHRNKFVKKSLLHIGKYHSIMHKHLIYDISQTYYLQSIGTP